ncbi:hypothetical protein GM708_16235 [Vibrio cholerae]|nr:hypothetical protein [Vibrio cholerae]
MQGTVLSDAGSPMPGVVVSDGLRVTRTDEDGRFRIDQVRGPVFITRPLDGGSTDGTSAQARSTRYSPSAQLRCSCPSVLHISQTPTSAREPAIPNRPKSGPANACRRPSARSPRLIRDSRPSSSRET